jgi:hypothetical protein
LFGIRKTQTQRPKRVKSGCRYQLLRILSTAAVRLGVLCCFVSKKSYAAEAVQRNLKKENPTTDVSKFVLKRA